MPRPARNVQHAGSAPHLGPVAGRYRVRVDHCRRQRRQPPTGAHGDSPTGIGGACRVGRWPCPRVPPVVDGEFAARRSRRRDWPRCDRIRSRSPAKAHSDGLAAPQTHRAQRECPGHRVRRDASHRSVLRSCAGLARLAIQLERSSKAGRRHQHAGSGGVHGSAGP